MKKKLNEVTADFLTDGIFNYIAAAAGVDLPWTVTPDVLNAEYYGNHSGRKIIAPLLKTLLKNANAKQLTTANLTQLGRVIWNRYGKQWVKLYAVFSAEYDPIENYSMTERESVEGSNTGTVGNTETRSGSNTGTQGVTHSLQGSNTGTVTDSGTESRDIQRDNEVVTDTEGNSYIYGYDSSTEAPADKTTTATTTTGSETTDEDVTRSNTRTDNLASTESGTQTRTDNLQHSETANGTRTDNLQHAEDRTLTRSGNIGVTTSQQMLESEITLWQYDFFEIVYKNIDNVLTIPVY